MLATVIRFSFLFLILISMSCSKHEIDVSSFEKPTQSTVILEETDASQLFINAIKDQNLENIKKLSVEFDLNTKIKDQYPLEIAVQFERIKSIRLLRQLGADISKSYIADQLIELWVVTLPESKSSLKNALTVDLEAEKILISEFIKKNNFKELKKIVEFDVDLNFLSINGETPLTEALKLKAQMALRALFLSGNLDYNLRNSANESPLFLAKKLNNPNIENEIIKRGGLL